MKEFLKAMRLPVSTMAGILVLDGFCLAGEGLRAGWLPALATFHISIATMAQNDLRDRWSDVKKGKRFAYDHPVVFRRFVVLLWLLAVAAVIVLYRLNYWYSILGSGMIVSGLIYSELRRIPLIPNLMVAMTVASVLLFPICDGHFDRPMLWAIFITVFLIIGAREVLKDFDDREVDPGYKWSSLQRYGEDGAEFIAALLLFGSARLLQILTVGLFCFPAKLVEEPAWLLIGEIPSAQVIRKAKLGLDFGLLALSLLFLFANLSV